MGASRPKISIVLGEFVRRHAIYREGRRLALVPSRLEEMAQLRHCSRLSPEEADRRLYGRFENRMPLPRQPRQFANRLHDESILPVLIFRVMRPAWREGHAPYALSDKFNHFDNFGRKRSLLFKLLQRNFQILGLPEKRRKGVAQRPNHRRTEARSAESDGIDSAQGVRPIHQTERWHIAAGAA